MKKPEKKYLDHCFLCGTGIDMLNSDQRYVCDNCINNRKEEHQISQCPHCLCMTKTVCGKCGKVK